MADSASAPSDKHLWFTNPTGSSFKYLVSAISNFRWPLASLKPQVAVCGFFRTLEEAQAYQARHQRYKPGTNNTIPLGPIFLALETCRLFPLAASPQRLFGADTKHMARKRDAIIRNYYRMREIEKQEVTRRKGKEDEDNVTKISDAEIKRDVRLRRSVLRRARRQAWEVLQRLEAQLVRVERLRSIVRAREEAAKDPEDADPELLDLLEKMTPAQIKEMMGGGSEAAGAGAGAGAGGSEAAGAGESEGKEEGETAVAKNSINPTPNTKQGTIEAFIQWAVKHFKAQGIEPASDEMMDEEERKEEEEAMHKLMARKSSAGAGVGQRDSGSGVGAAAGSQDDIGSSSGDGTGNSGVCDTGSQALGALPAAPAGQSYCIGTIFHDTTGAALNKALPEATGKEHVVAFFEPYGTAEEAKTSLQNAYARAFSEESMFYIRIGQWCCFDNVTDDDGDQLYREDTMQEMFEGHAKNSMLQFIEESFAHRPDILPIPTAK